MFVLFQIIVVVLSYASSARAQSHFVSVCNHASEPTVGEIFSFVSPINPAEMCDFADKVSGLVTDVTATDTLDHQHDQDAFMSHHNEEKLTHHGLLMRAFQDVTVRLWRAFAEVRIDDVTTSRPVCVRHAVVSLPFYSVHWSYTHQLS